jgi:type I restriction enzyme R subunit
MRAALPNACFLGFTGTPIDKKDKSTLTTFGPYIDTYTIEQAVADKATVPIYYESRLPELQIIGQNLDKIFDHVFSERSKEERAAIKKKYATEEAIAGAPRRVEAICLDLMEHFKKFIQPNGFKAQLVAVNRHTAVTYKETLDRLNGPDSALIMSAAHNDPERLARWHMSREQQDHIVEQFKNGDSPQILIVCDMLLTGFDATVEQVMYLDSPFKEHGLLQAIARVNRTADKKDYGLVVDYWGVSEELEEALAIFSSTDVQGALTPKTDELPRLQRRHQAALRFFQKVTDKSDLDECIKLLEPEDVRAEFDVAFRRFSQSMDMLLPEKRALPYLDDVRWLGKIRQAARARYHDARLDIKDCGAKVREIIDEAIVADKITILVTEVPLFSKEFEEKLGQLKTTKAKASEMEHAIRHEIHVKLEENPAFYESLRERLEEIIEEHKQERIDAAEQLKLFLEHKEALGAEHETAQEIGLTETAYAIYGLLENARPSEAKEPDPGFDEPNRDLASLLDDAVEPYTELVDWQLKDDIQRQMRSKIKKQLRASGMKGDDVEKLATDIVDLAKVRKG